MTPCTYECVVSLPHCKMVRVTVQARDMAEAKRIVQAQYCDGKVTSARRIW